VFIDLIIDWWVAACSNVLTVREWEFLGGRFAFGAPAHAGATLPESFSALDFKVMAALPACDYQ
jgi:hypothetical protein